MSSTTTLPQTAKPGTACLGCRRRKLKCSREDGGCSNCLRGELPCVYPAPETGVKRKRGPYRKDRATRAEHLRDLVKYLQPENDGQGGAGTGPPTASEAGRQIGNSEDLVQDALNALTTIRPSEHEVEAHVLPVLPRKPYQRNEPGTIALHPPVRRIFEYVHLYEVRVDPMLKLIHGPTFRKQLLKATDDLQAAGPVMETLLFAIYYSAVSTCTSREAYMRFGEERSVLLQRYGRVVESMLADNYSVPAVESLQALVLYVLIGVHKDPDGSCGPYDAEMRRRLWWHIAGLESRGAEEGGARQSSIMDECNVRLPANLNDWDLDPNATEAPQSRTGVTEMTWVLLRWQIVRLTHDITNVKRKFRHGGLEESKVEQRKVLESHRRRFDDDFIRYLHPSRPYDWLCIAWIEGMMTKCRLMVDFKTGEVPNKDMPAKDRYNLLQGSVDVIRLTQAVANHQAIEQWAWYFRGWVQWHAIAIVIAELGYNKNQQFVNYAWAVLDPVLGDWDKVYEAKRDEPAWAHVNALVSRARDRRQHMPVQTDATQVSQQATVGAGPAILAGPVDVFPAVWPTDSTRHGASSAILPADHAATEGGLGQNQFQVPVPFANGCAPLMPASEWDFGDMGGMDDIDFSAFEGVFKDVAWDFSNPSTDFSWSATNP